MQLNLLFEIVRMYMYACEIVIPIIIYNYNIYVYPCMYVKLIKLKS